MSSVAAWKRDILRTVAVLLAKDDNLMPDEIDPDSADGRRWQNARDNLVEEFDRRGITRPRRGS